MKFKITQDRGEEIVSFPSRDAVEKYVQENYRADLGTVRITDLSKPKSKAKPKIEWKR